MNQTQILPKLETCSRDNLILIVNQKEELLQQKEEICQHLQEEIEYLRQIILNANRALYGQKSEKYENPENNQIALFGEPQNKQAEPGPDELQEIQYLRQKRKKDKKDLKDLPRIIKDIKVAEKNRYCTCGCEKKVMGYDKKEMLHYQPAKLAVIEERREVLVCPKCEDGKPVIAPAPNCALPKVKATPELLAHIAVSKIIDRQPLYHLEKQFASRFDCPIPRNTMARWMIQMAEVTWPLVNLMKDTFLNYDIGWMDSTKLQVLHEPDRNAETKSYAYCIEGGSPGKEVIIFEYNPTDQKEYLKDFFEGFKGTLHGDADRLYDDLEKAGDIKLSYCNAHSRRKFEQIVTNTKKPGIAGEILKIYQQIYKVEKEAKAQKLNAEELKQLRQTKSKILMNQIKEILDKNAHLQEFKLALGQAIKYCLTHWPGLIRFLDDGRLEPDNNRCERNIRPFVIARKNFLFADSVAGAEALGVHFSLLATAKKHDLDPYNYYVYILNNIPDSRSFSDYEKLLPWNYKKTISGILI